jgi:hypothetical protein
MPRVHFHWVAISPYVWECKFEGLKLRIEKTRGGFEGSVNHPGRGWIKDGVEYDTKGEAAEAAERSALDSLRQNMV